MIIHKKYSMLSLNTFAVDQCADAFMMLKKYSDILDAVQVESRPFILGGGSNILLTKDIDRLVVKNELYGKKILQEDDRNIWVQFQSGENWHEVVRWCVHQGWGGVENLSLIPGTIGAAPIQNIGAYGVELKDVMSALEAVDLTTGHVESFENVDCQFGYRDSFFKQAEQKGKYFIQNVTLKLDKKPAINATYADIEKKIKEKSINNLSISDIHQVVIEVRQQKLPDPHKLANAGSFFKNPIITVTEFDRLKTLNHEAPGFILDAATVKVPAGWLIDKAGWKGRRIGQVGCYERQALVLVNHGGASGAEIWAVAQLVQQDVLEKFGIPLEPEINIW